MNLSRAKQSIVTRIAHSAEGVAFVLKLLVIENESGIELRVLSATPVNASTDATSNVSSKSSSNLLEKPLQKSTSPLPVRRFFEHVISPFADDLSFFISQPTRAPSFC